MSNAENPSIPSEGELRQAFQANDLDKFKSLWKNIPENRRLQYFKTTRPEDKNILDRALENGQVALAAFLVSERVQLHMQLMEERQHVKTSKKHEEVAIGKCFDKIKQQTDPKITQDILSQLCQELATTYYREHANFINRMQLPKVRCLTREQAEAETRRTGQPVLSILHDKDGLLASYENEYYIMDHVMFTQQDSGFKVVSRLQYGEHHNRNFASIDEIQKFLLERARSKQTYEEELDHSTAPLGFGQMMELKKQREERHRQKQLQLNPQAQSPKGATRSA